MRPGGFQLTGCKHPGSHADRCRAAASSSRHILLGITDMKYTDVVDRSESAFGPLDRNLHQFGPVDVVRTESPEMKKAANANLI